jgi:hypothetical protein
MFAFSARKARKVPAATRCSVNHECGACAPRRACLARCHRGGEDLGPRFAGRRPRLGRPRRHVFAGGGQPRSQTPISGDRGSKIANRPVWPVPQAHRPPPASLCAALEASTTTGATITSSGSAERAAADAVHPDPRTAPSSVEVTGWPLTSCSRRLDLRRSRCSPVLSQLR